MCRVCVFAEYTLLKKKHCLGQQLKYNDFNFYFSLAKSLNFRTFIFKEKEKMLKGKHQNIRHNSIVHVWRLDGIVKLNRTQWIEKISLKMMRWKSRTKANERRMYQITSSAKFTYLRNERKNYTQSNFQINQFECTPIG